MSRALALAFGLASLAAGPALAADPCPRHGPGFVRLADSETCLRVGGRVRAEVGSGWRPIARERIAGFGTSGQVAAETRTDTAYGPVRTYTRVTVGQGVDARR